MGRVLLGALVTSGCGFSIGIAPPSDGARPDGASDGSTVDMELAIDAAIDAPLPSNLIAWYPMDVLDNETGIDATLHGHDARCGGSFTGGCPDVVPGHIGNGYSFDGNVDRMDVASTTMLTTTDGFTVAFWVQFASFPNAYSCAVGKYFGNGMSNSWQLCNNTSSGGRWFYGAESDETFTLDATPGPETDVWYHAAITWDRATQVRRIWLGGVIRATQNNVAMIDFDGGRVTLGADLSSGSQADRFAGIIDDVRIYNEALSDQEIQALAMQ